jgi:hypothetical protein
MMPTRTSTRARNAPKRFEEEVFVAGANNKYTVGRVVDAGQGVCQVDGSEHRMSAAEAAELARVEMAELYEACRTPDIDAWNAERLAGGSTCEFEDWQQRQPCGKVEPCGKVPCGKVRCGKVPCGKVRCGKVPCGAAGNQMEELGRGEWTEPKAKSLSDEEKAENDRRFREDLCDRGMCGDNCVLCADDVEEYEELRARLRARHLLASSAAAAAAAGGEDQEEEEEEEEAEEDWLDTTDKLYWGEIMPLPARVRWFSLKNGIWNRCCYAKKIGEDRWLVAPLDWLEECPEKMVDEQEWLDNSIGVLTNTELHVNEYVVGDFEEAFGRKAEPSRWMAMPDDE